MSSDSAGKEKGLFNSYISIVIQGAFVSPGTCSFHVCGLARGAKLLLWNSSSSLCQVWKRMSIHHLSLAQGQGWASPAAQNWNLRKLLRACCCPGTAQPWAIAEPVAAPAGVLQKVLDLGDKEKAAAVQSRTHATSATECSDEALRASPCLLWGKP